MPEAMQTADTALEERLGYKFSNRELLDRALTHSSAIPELRGAGQDSPGDLTHLSDNERLEFLGDAVLELLASEHLLAAFPEWSEGQLSKSRARIVNAISLEAAARRLRLGEHRRLGRRGEKTGGRGKQKLAPPQEAAQEPMPVTKPEEHREETTLSEYLESLLVTVILALFGTTFIVQAFKIPSASMEGTLLIGDHLLVNKFIFGGTGAWYEKVLPYRPLERGDIIVFKFPYQ